MTITVLVVGTLPGVGGGFRNLRALPDQAPERRELCLSSCWSLHAALLVLTKTVWPGPNKDRLGEASLAPRLEARDGQT